MKAHIIEVVPQILAEKVADSQPVYDEKYGLVYPIQRELLQWIETKYPDNSAELHDKFASLNLFADNNLAGRIELSELDNNTKNIQVELDSEIPYNGLDKIYDEFLKDPQWGTPGSYTITYIS